MNKGKRKIVEIVWEDSYASHRWNQVADHLSGNDAASRIVSTGYLVSKDDKFVRYTSGFDEQDSPNLECLHSIPVSAVRRFRVIRK